VKVEGRIGVVGDPTFSGVIWELLEEAGEAVFGSGRDAPFVVSGTVGGSGSWRWGAVELEGQDGVYSLLLLLSDGSVKRDGGRHGRFRER
jgi:hypothetical protein